MKAPNAIYSSAGLLKVPEGFAQASLTYGIASKVQDFRDGSRSAAAMELETRSPWGNTSRNHPPLPVSKLFGSLLRLSNAGSCCTKSRIYPKP